MSETLEVMNQEPLAAHEPLPVSHRPSRVPNYAFPIVGGLFVIIVFCTMIGVLILQPNTEDRKRMRRRDEKRRESRLRQVASESWTTELERTENRIMSDEEMRHVGD